MTNLATIVFLGHFQTESFLDFMAHRARRLALRAGVRSASAERIEISVMGEDDLVDAFEIACTLGPIDCVVRDHRRIMTVTVDYRQVAAYVEQGLPEPINRASCA